MDDGKKGGREAEREEVNVYVYVNTCVHGWLVGEAGEGWIRECKSEWAASTHNRRL